MSLNIHAYRPVVQPLLAYIDPQSGSLLLQLLIAGFIGFLASLRKTIVAFASKLIAKRRRNVTRLD